MELELEKFGPCLFQRIGCLTKGGEKKSTKNATKIYRPQLNCGRHLSEEFDAVGRTAPRTKLVSTVGE